MAWTTNRVTKLEGVTILEVLKNGQPASASNPIAFDEFGSVEWPDANGQLVVISGMPMSVVAGIALHYKNLFGAVAIANPRNGVAEIVHSVSPNYKAGATLPLPSLV